MTDTEWMFIFIAWLAPALGVLFLIVSVMMAVNGIPDRISPRKSPLYWIACGSIALAGSVCLAWMTYLY